MASQISRMLKALFDREARAASRIAEVFLRSQCPEVLVLGAHLPPRRPSELSWRSPTRNWIHGRR